MSDYTRNLGWAKDAVTSMVTTLVAKESGKQSPSTLMDLAARIDELNKAWDELTDCLVRQRDERDSQLRRLIDDLAETRKQ